MKYWFGWGLAKSSAPAQTFRGLYSLSGTFYFIISIVFYSGLFLEGASLDRKTGKLVESRPKVLYEQMPVIYIYAINTTAGKDSKLYECPIYRKPARTDLNYIGSIDFESDIGPKHWTMRGVALLCDIKWIIRDSNWQIFYLVIAFLSDTTSSQAPLSSKLKRSHNKWGIDRASRRQQGCSTCRRRWNG